MPVGHYQLFKFSLTSESVLPDNRIVLLLPPTHFRSCPPFPSPPCVLKRVMGTVFAHWALPAIVHGQGLTVLMHHYLLTQQLN